MNADVNKDAPKKEKEDKRKKKKKQDNSDESDDDDDDYDRCAVCADDDKRVDLQRVSTLSLNRAVLCYSTFLHSRLIDHPYL